MDRLLRPETTAEWLEPFGWWAILISLVLNVTISILGVVPSVFLSGANAILFGLPIGFAVSLAGEAIGAYFTFILFRMGITAFRKEDKLRGKWSKAFIQASGSKQFTLLLVARIIPFIPSGLITFLASWTKMKMAPFMAATILGKTPSIATEVWVGYGFFQWLFKTV